MVVTNTEIWRCSNSKSRTGKQDMGNRGRTKEIDGDVKKEMMEKCNQCGCEMFEKVGECHCPCHIALGRLLEMNHGDKTETLRELLEEVNKDKFNPGPFRIPGVGI